MNCLGILLFILSLSICDSNNNRHERNRSQESNDNLPNTENYFDNSQYLHKTKATHSHRSNHPSHQHHHHNHHHHQQQQKHQHRRRHEQDNSSKLSSSSYLQPLYLQTNSSQNHKNYDSSSNSHYGSFARTNKSIKTVNQQISSQNNKKIKSNRNKAFTYRALKREKKRPNIIFMLTDDQDIEMNSMQYMPKTRKILIDEGIEARHAYVTTPMCCPSRSSILTGLYAHNHNVYTNGENCSSTTWQRTHERKTFATYLRDAGYRTAYFGKYLNEYNGSYIPPGWTDWSGLIKNSRYYNYTLNVNGDHIRHGDDYSSDYYPDLILNDTLQYMRYSRRFFSSRPYLIVMSFPSPHGTEDAAPQFQKQFFGEQTHRTPSWNVAPNSDKQWILRQTGSMTPLQQHFTDFLHTKRLQTLQSVDDAVAKVYEELKALNELDNTYIVYTSDNGYHLGQFGLVKGKAMPFEFDIRVPFFVRGPDLPGGTVLKDIVLNIDIAPTFMDIAGIKTPNHMDGNSFLPALRSLANEDNSATLIRNDKNTNKNSRNVRHSFLIEKGKFKFQPRNVDQLLIPIVGKKQWLQIECQKPEYRSPCASWQRFECYRDQENNYRIRKCRWKRRASSVGKRRYQTPSSLCLCSQNKTFDISESNDILRLQSRVRRDEESSQKDFFSDLFSQMFSDDSNSDLSDSVSGNFDALGVYELKRLIDLARNRLQTSPEMGNITGQQLGMIMRSASEKNISTIKDVIKDKTYCTVERTNLTIECQTIQTKESKNISDYYNRSDLNFAIKALQKRLHELKEIRRIIKDKNRENQIKSDIKTESRYCDCATQEPISRNLNSKKEFQEYQNDNRKFYQNSHQNNHHPRHFRSPASAYINRKLLKQLNRKKLLKKHERKLKKKGRFENTTCQNSEQMNCFYHDNNHWKTPPLWNDGPFCFCQNSLNNSFWCMRTINSTHNTLYCEFVTGFMLYFDLDDDPYQLRNAIYDLEFSTLEQLSYDLAKLKDCSGTSQCSSTGFFNSKSKNSQNRNRNTVFISNLSTENINDHSLQSTIQ